MHGPLRSVRQTWPPNEFNSIVVQDSSDNCLERRRCVSVITYHCVAFLLLLSDGNHNALSIECPNVIRPKSFFRQTSIIVNHKTISFRLIVPTFTLAFCDRSVLACWRGESLTTFLIMYVDNLQS